MLEGSLRRIGTAIVAGSAAGIVLLGGESPQVVNAAYSESTSSPESYPPVGRVDCLKGETITATKSGGYAVQGSIGTVGEVSVMGSFFSGKKVVGEFNIVYGPNDPNHKTNMHTRAKENGARFIEPYPRGAKVITVDDVTATEQASGAVSIYCSARRINTTQVDNLPLETN